MKIAYIILAHKSPEQILRLISRLNSDSTSFFIHIDKNTDDKTYHQVFTQLNTFPNVYFVKRYISAWGAFGLVRAILEGIKTIVETGIDFDYVIHLSGQDYLIKSNRQIKNFLQGHAGKEFLEYFPLPYSGWRGLTEGIRRIEYWHVKIFGRYFCIPEKRKYKHRMFSYLYSTVISVIPKRKFPKEFTLYGGSAFWCLTGECAKWINSFVKHNPKFLKRFNHTLIPDELFFQTLILNSIFKDNVINDNLRYIDWYNPNPYVPATFEKQDFERLSRSEKLFARKFDIARDASILDLIDEKILSE